MSKQSIMNKEFVPYEEALELKELGFNEPCLASYYHAGKRLDICEYINHGEYTVLAPIYSQVFRWFRDKYEYGSLVRGRKSMGFEYILSDVPTNLSKRDTFQSPHVYKTYEEAELACLRKLIEIVKQKNNNEQQ